MAEYEKKVREIIIANGCRFVMLASVEFNHYESGENRQF